MSTLVTRSTTNPLINYKVGKTIYIPLTNVTFTVTCNDRYTDFFKHQAFPVLVDRVLKRMLTDNFIEEDSTSDIVVDLISLPQITMGLERRLCTQEDWEKHNNTNVLATGSFIIYLREYVGSPGIPVYKFDMLSQDSFAYV